MGGVCGAWACLSFTGTGSAVIDLTCPVSTGAAFIEEKMGWEKI